MSHNQAEKNSMSLLRPIPKLIWRGGILLLVLCGCGGTVGEGTAVSATPPTDATANALATRIMAAAAEMDTGVSANFAQQIEEAKSRWAAHNIDDYTVTVRYNQPGWNTQLIDLTVQDGMVTDHKQDCYPPRDCTLQKIDPAEFTIDRLLAAAEYVGNLTMLDQPAEITFSQTYGYPSSISYEDGFWSLTQFQPTNP